MIGKILLISLFLLIAILILFLICAIIINKEDNDKWNRY